MHNPQCLDEGEQFRARGTATDDWLDYRRLKPERPKPLVSISRKKSNHSGAIHFDTHTQIERDT